MRYMLFLFFLAWVPVVYYATSRFVSAPVAGALTLLAVAWGPPNYAAALPSWYNLFLATFGLAALLRYIETQTGLWLLIAGACGGISILFKLPGLFFVAGAFFFLVYREQLAPSAEVGDRRETRSYRGFVITSILLYEALLFGLLRKLANSATYYYFWVPELAIGAAVVWNEIYASRHRSQRFYFLLRELLLFVAGVAIPIAVFLVPYLLTGSVGFLVRDIFGISSNLIVRVGMKPPVQWFRQGIEVNALLIALVLSTRSKITPKLWKQILFVVSMVILIPSLLLLARRSRYYYQHIWSTIWVFAPVVVVVGVGLLARWSWLNRLDSVARQRLFLTLTVTAACSLIQFPSATPSIFATLRRWFCFPSLPWLV